ncbi:unnamed protein product [Caenorhabditis nigoni]
MTPRILRRAPSELTLHKKNMELRQEKLALQEQTRVLVKEAANHIDWLERKEKDMLIERLLREKNQVTNGHLSPSLPNGAFQTFEDAVKYVKVHFPLPQIEKVDDLDRYLFNVNDDERVNPQLKVRVEAAQAQYNVPNRKCEGEDKCQNESRIPPNAEFMGLVKPSVSRRRSPGPSRSSCPMRSQCVLEPSGGPQPAEEAEEPKNLQRRLRPTGDYHVVASHQEMSTGNSPMSKNEAEFAEDLVASIKKLMGPSFKIGCVKEVEERPDSNKKLFDEDMVHHFGEHQKDNSSSIWQADEAQLGVWKSRKGQILKCGYYGQIGKGFVK